MMNSRKSTRSTAGRRSTGPAAAGDTGTVGKPSRRRSTDRAGTTAAPAAKRAKKQSTTTASPTQPKTPGQQRKSDAPANEQQEKHDEPAHDDTIKETQPVPGAGNAAPGAPATPVAAALPSGAEAIAAVQAARAAHNQAAAEFESTLNTCTEILADVGAKLSWETPLAAPAEPRAVPTILNQILASPEYTAIAKQWEQATATLSAASTAMETAMRCGSRLLSAVQGIAHADDAAWAAGAAAEIGARAEGFGSPNKAAQGVLAEWTAQGANTAGWTPRRTLAFALVAGEADPQPPLQLAAAAVVAREGPGATPGGSSRMARLFSRARHDIEGADPNHNRLSPPDAPPGAGGGPATQGDGGPVKPLKPPAVDELESRIRALEAQLRAANTTTISEGAVTHMTNSDHHLGDRVTAATVSETDREADVETDEEDRDVAGHGDPQGTSRIAAAAKTFAKDSSIHAASLAPMPSLPHLAREQDASPDLTIPSLTASVTAKLFDTMLTRINDKGVRVPSYPPDQNHLDHYDQLRALRHIAPPAATEDAGLHPIIDWGFTAWVLLDDAKSARANDSATEASERRAAARRSDPKSMSELPKLFDKFTSWESFTARMLECLTQIQGKLELRLCRALSGHDAAATAFYQARCAQAITELKDTQAVADAHKAQWTSVVIPRIKRELARIAQRKAPAFIAAEPTSEPAEVAQLRREVEALRKAHDQYSRAQETLDKQREKKRERDRLRQERRQAERDDPEAADDADAKAEDGDDTPPAPPRKTPGGGRHGGGRGRHGGRGGRGGRH